MDPLISVGQLSRELRDFAPGHAGRPALLDVRWQLGGPPGGPQYETGHLPGAHYVDLDAELAGPPGEGGRHPLPAPEVFEAAMRRAGVSAGRDVVVYDGGDSMAAARAWWMLRSAGHTRVRVLDGGLRAWIAAGLPLDRGSVPAEDGDFTVRPAARPPLTADEAAEVARSGLLLDARAAERYRGETEPVDAVAGHIPGAVNAPTTGNLAADGHFLPREALTARFTALGAHRAPRVAVYCGSGITACHEILAMEQAGITADLYPGSWSEWITDPTRPVASGPDPA
jgi:thiosulfate/3-mercaptopyruvate sulfurtransferase